MAWYSIIGSNNNPKLAEPLNRTPAITVPWASDFFDPQKRAVIRSTRLSFTQLLTRLIKV